MTDQPTTDTEQQELFNAVEVDTRTVPLDAVEPTPETAPASLDNAIGKLGLVSTPLLQLEKDSDEYGYRIVDGVRRIATLRAQGKEEVEAHIVGPEFEAEAAALTAVLNIVRDPAPLREAEKIGDLIENRGYTPESLSRIGIPQSKTKKRLRLWHAPERIKDGVREGDIAVGTAEKVANLSPDLQEECADFYEREGKLRHKDVKEIRQADREEQAEELPQTAFDTPDVSREEPSESGEGEAPPEENTAESPVHREHFSDLEPGQTYRVTPSFEDDGVSMEIEEVDDPEGVSIPADGDTFSDYIVIAGIVREYLQDETWDPTAEEVAQAVVSTATEMGLAPEEGLALLTTGPAHFLPDDAITALQDQLS